MRLYPAIIKRHVTESIDLIMKNYAQILENLKLYLEYLRQDKTCNPKVLKYVEREISRLETYLQI